MKYQIIGKNIQVTEGISQALKTKLSKLDKYFSKNDNVDCRAVVRSYKKGAKVEITISTSNMTFRSEVTDSDLYAAIDLSIDKLKDQMRRLKTQMLKKYGNNGLGKSIVYDEIDSIEKDEENGEVVRTKSYDLTPMSLDEAITRMIALDHDFFLYLDKEDEKISVVYKRNEGGFGLIQAENEIKTNE
ncbi:MAG TPA: ribosome-associated translation inhibitor RaiA [Firmicutes bacterium]|nr:ribosome-associated translation inhibitor RaiA [Bacillota bacterium]